MNREVLANKFTPNGEYYANDALQHICAVINNYSLSKLLHLQSRAMDDGDKSVYDLPEYKAQAKAQDAAIKMFNNVVALGEEAAMEFVNNNYK